MQLQTFPTVLSLLLLCSCSTTRPSAPAKIDPPPVALAMPCETPADLAPTATAKDLATWATLWIEAYGCERSRRAALLQSWPR